MYYVVWIIAIVVGLPVTLIFGGELYQSFLKHKQLKLEERRLAMEEKMRSDALNSRLIEMDDLGISPLEIVSMQEEMRQLRAEVANLHQELDNRIVG